MLEGSQAYTLDLKGLFSADLKIFKDTARFKDNVFLMAPYRPGRIPLVLVHGTASSPARWAQMLNEILNDRELWNRYQIWLFTYNTGNPILYSGGILIQGLRNVVQQLDPAGKDSALRKTVWPPSSSSTPATPHRNRHWPSRRCAESSLRISRTEETNDDEGF